MRWPSSDLTGSRKALGIPCLALFPNTPRGLRSERGEEALNPDNLMCRAAAAAGEEVVPASEYRALEAQARKLQ